MGKKQATATKAQVSTPDAEAVEENPLGLPWYADYDHDRLVLNAEHEMVAVATTPELAELIAMTVSAGDLDAKAEVTRLTALVGHYRHRSQMTVSDRQHYLDEDIQTAIQPENYYIEKVATPGKRLRDAVRDAAATLVLAGAPDDDEVVVALRAAAKAYDKAVPAWM